MSARSTPSAGRITIPRALARALDDARRRRRSNGRSTSRAAPACRPSRCARSPTSWSAPTVRPRCSRSPRASRAGASRAIGRGDAAVRDAIVRRGHGLLRRPLVRPAALLRGGAPAAATPAAGSRSTTTTSSARWSTCPSSREWARVALERYPLPPRNPQVGDPACRDARRLRQGRRRVLRRRHRHDAAAVRRLPAVDQQLRGRVRTRHAARRAARVAVRDDRAVLRGRRVAGPCASSARSPVYASPRSSRRSGLPPGLRGISSTSTQLAGQLRGRRAGRGRSRAARRATVAGRASLATTYATTRSPHSSSATPTMHTSCTAAWCASTPSTSVGLTLTPPVITRSFLRSTTRTRPSSISRDVAGREPAVGVEHVGGLRGIEAVAAHHHRAAHEQLAVGAERALGARDRDAVERPAAPRLGHPVRVDDLHAERFGARSQRRRARRAADDHAAVLVHRRAGVEQPAQRVGTTRHDRRALGARRARDAVDVEAVVHGPRDAGDVRAREHAEARDVVQRQAREPAVAGAGVEPVRVAAAHHLHAGARELDALRRRRSCPR